MIKSTNTINIDGTTLNYADLNKLFSMGQNDTFSRWVLKPLAILAAMGLAVAAVFASVFLVMLSIALIPLILAFMWAMKKKMLKDLADADPVVHSQPKSTDEPDDSVTVAG